MTPEVVPLAEALTLEKEKQIIWIDFSTISAFAMCEEKARLSYIEHHSPNKRPRALSFGGAIHKGIETYEVLSATHPEIEEKERRQQGVLSFIQYCKDKCADLPIEMTSDEPRSLERGSYILEAYFEKYINEPFVNVINRTIGQPYIEIGFAIYIMDWWGVPVMYVGRIDKIKKSRIDGGLHIFETKTTRMGLTNHAKQVRPNHQISGYHLAAKELLQFDIIDTNWDAIFISNRKADESKSGWAAFGVDIEKDFLRTPTRRSSTDLDEFLIDLKLETTHYLTRKYSNLPRWHRNAPTACHMYNGCVFRDVCSTNGNESILRSDFHREVWEPWKGVVIDED